MTSQGKLNNFGVFIALLFLLVGLNNVNAEPTTVVTSDKFRPISFKTYNGLMRLGLQDHAGFDDPKLASNNPTGFQQQVELAYNNDYSFGLLTHLDFIRRNPQCFSNMSTYGAFVEYCLQSAVDDQSSYWSFYLGLLAKSMQVEEYAQQFCDGKQFCSVENIEGLHHLDKNNRRIPLDEFEKRDWFNRLVKEYFPHFESYWRQAVLPEYAYVVTKINLSEYDFDQARYTFDLEIEPGSFSDPTLYSGTQHAGFRTLPVTLTYTPIANYEEKEKTFYRRKTIYWPVANNKAREVLDNFGAARSGYAVFKIRLGRSSDIKQNSAAASRYLDFHIAENNVQLFNDLQLKHKIIDLPIFAAKTSSVSNAAVTQANVYVPSASRDYLDERTLGLLRLKNVTPLLDEQLAHATQFVLSEEAKIWKYFDLIKHSTESVLALPKDNKSHELKRKQAEDRARLKAYTWSDFPALNAQQQAAYLDALSGVGLGEVVSNRQQRNFNWPPALERVLFGSNFISIFNRQYFPADLNSYQARPNATSTAMVLSVFKTMSSKYNNTSMMLARRLDNLSYDNVTKKLTLKGVLLGSQQVEVFEPNHKYTTVHEPLISENVVDRFMTTANDTSWATPLRYPNPIAADCELDQVTKSRDCITRYHVFTAQRNWYDFLALDRMPSFPGVVFTPEQVDKYAQWGNLSEKDGWRVVLELKNTYMDVVQYPVFNAKNALGMRSEQKTVVADLERVLLLAPDNTIIWESAADQLPSAESKLKLTTDIPADLSQINELVPEIHDFLFARYAPERLVDDLLYAMYSSRWFYEKESSDPIGGRYFNMSARQPSKQTVSDTLPAFKSWLIAGGKTLPTVLKAKLNLHYFDNVVEVNDKCASVVIDPDAKVRVAATNNEKNQLIRQCENENKQALRKYQQCSDISNKRLEQDEKIKSLEEKYKQCNIDIRENDSDSKVQQTFNDVKTSEICGVALDASLTSISSSAQSCVKDKCMPMMASGNQAEFEKCIKEVQKEIGALMKTAVSKSGFMSGNQKNSDNTCSVIEDELQQKKAALPSLNQRYEQSNCNTYQSQPEAKLCNQPAGEEVKFLRLTKISYASMCSTSKAFMRSTSDFVGLHGDSKPLMDSSINLELVINDRLEIPYDQPINTSARQNFLYQISIQRVEPASEPNKLRLAVKVTKS